MKLQNLLKSIIPKQVLNLRHLYFAWRGSARYSHPSEKLMVVGVTGTSGKSSTIYFLKQILESTGLKVGALSTVEFCVAGKCKLNDKKMTMLGKMEIQKYLAQMVEDNCDVALIETTSEGAVQHRHRFINYDTIALTNFYPEHIESHGSFENYKKAKLSIFKYISKSKRKKVNGNKIEKTAVVNSDIKEAGEFLTYTFDSRESFSKKDAENIKISEEGISFSAYGQNYTSKLFGEYNVMNLLLCIKLAKTVGLSEEQIKNGISKLKSVPGRIEFIEEAEEKGFKVVVDYAFEPVAMKALYDVVGLIKPKRVIHVFGSTGGGRDIERRFTVGKLVGEKADICIVTDEDPYNDDPQKIIDDVAAAVEKTGKTEGKSLFKILSRSEAIKKAMSVAEAGDLVLVTGKGSEQAMVVKDKLLPWDDRDEVRKALASL